MERIKTYSSLSDINMTEEQMNEEAATILHSATLTVQRILERRRELDRKGQQDKALIVPIGGDHTVPSHYLNYMLILKGLIENDEKTVFDYEFEHNRLSQTFFNKRHRRYDQTIEKIIQERNRNGTLDLQCYSSFLEVDEADYSVNTLFRYLRQNDQINVRFTDAARPRNYIDVNDRSTAHSTKECLNRIIKNIPHDSPKGIEIRNHHTTKTMIGFAKNNMVRIAIQHGGNIHINGNEKVGCKSHHGLSACFKSFNAPVLAIHILCESFNKSCISSNTLSKNEIYICSDLPDKQAIYIPFTDESIPNRPADFECRAAEAFYMNALLERVGMKNECLTLDEYQKEMQTLQVDTNKQFEEWDNEFFPTFLDRVKNQMGKPWSP